MKKLRHLLAIAVTASPLALTGCGLEQDPAYSSNVQYGVRTDPILKTAAADLGDERYDPDRPGVFPLAKLDDFVQPDHPYYAKLNMTKLAPAAISALSIKDPQGRTKLRMTLDTVFRDPTALAPKEHKELDDALKAVFGTPTKPTVKEAGIDPKAIAALKLDDETLANGSRRYRIHCLHCHGVTGDGRGPTARWINPHPRDFRIGKFKFTSIVQIGAQRPPSRADLLRTLRVGLEGTAMPSFVLLGDDELESIVSYVIHLSIRGDTEQYTIRHEDFEWKDGLLVWGANAQGAIDEAVKERARRLVETSPVSWLKSQDTANWIVPESYPYKDGDMAALKASVKRGKEMFIAKPSSEFIDEYIQRPALVDFKKKAEAEAAEKKLGGKEATAFVHAALVDKATNTLKAPNCVNCHTDYGRQAKFRFDDWGTLVRPNNFTAGIFRGGKRPIDMYYRIHSGISPSGMTNFGSVLQGQDIWDLVNFVSTVSFPAMRQKLDMNID